MNIHAYSRRMRAFHRPQQEGSVLPIVIILLLLASVIVLASLNVGRFEHKTYGTKGPSSLQRTPPFAPTRPNGSCAVTSAPNSRAGQSPQADALRCTTTTEVPALLSSNGF